MTSRYDDREERINADKKYKKLFKERNVTFIKQYVTPSLIYPSAEQIGDLMNYSHAWKLGDRFYKLADQYYKDPTKWWVIAWYNRTPTESSVSIGDIITIPTPLEKILEILDV